MSLLKEDQDFASKEITKFNKVFENLFQDYLKKYGSTTSIHDMMQNLRVYGSTLIIISKKFHPIIF